MKNMNKRIIMLLVLSIGIISSIVAQSTITHIVARGETLMSIAKKYGTTTERLLELNPSADQFVYVGMNLKIPEIEEFIEKDSVKVPISPITKIVSEDKRSTKVKSVRSTYFGIVAGFSLSNYVGEDVDTDLRGGFHAGFLMGYHLTSYSLVEVGLSLATKGYNSNLSSSSGNYWNENGDNYDIKGEASMRTYNLDIPILVGIHYKGFYLKAGPYLSIAMVGQFKTKGYYTYYSDIHSSETEHRNDSQNISDMKNFNRFNAGVSAGIGYQARHFLIGATYQRGFVKLLQNANVYEQNILINIGLLL